MPAPTCLLHAQLLWTANSTPQPDFLDPEPNTRALQASSRIDRAGRRGMGLHGLPNALPGQVLRWLYDNNIIVVIVLCKFGGGGGGPQNRGKTVWPPGILFGNDARVSGVLQNIKDSSKGFQDEFHDLLSSMPVWMQHAGGTATGKSPMVGR